MESPASRISPDERAVPWADPWYLDDDASGTAERELQREAPVGHALYGIPVTLVARRCDCDDVLFRLADGSGRYAGVHLSFAVESNPDWPSTIIYDSLSHFVTERLHEDVTDYNT